MRKDFWDEIKDEWPKEYWDEGIRNNKIRKNRVCIIPEISRSYTFGSKGTSFGNSANRFYRKYLKNIKLNSENIKWSKINYKPLLKNNYDLVIKEIVKESKEIAIEELSSILDKRDDNDGEIGLYKIYFEDIRDYKLKLKRMKMFDIITFGYARGSYHSLCIKRNNNKLIFLVPKYSTFYV